MIPLYHCGRPVEPYVVTTVLDLPDGAPAPAVEDAAGCHPATYRIGLLGLGNVGSAFARLAHDASASLATRGFAPLVSVALVRSLSRPRGRQPLPAYLTDDRNAFFSEPIDVIVEALGGVEPARSLVTEALERGIPVVTANKSLMAAHGESLLQLARRRATALRYEASCIAGVPFLGTFERRPLASRICTITAILNGTSNSILTAMAAGMPFEAALADAQRLGLAEPDPSMDVSGADATEKLSILLRLFGRLNVAPALLPVEGITAVEPFDIAAAHAFEGTLRPVVHADWTGTAVRAFTGPAFLPGTHPLARVSGVTNGIVLGAGRSSQCYIGPGAGPDVTAATLLDDVAEVASERRVCTPPPGVCATVSSVTRPETSWFVRVAGAARESDVADLLASYGIWCRRLERRGDRTFALTCPAGGARIVSALQAVRGATRTHAAAFPALTDGAAC